MFWKQFFPHYYCRSSENILYNGLKARRNILLNSALGEKISFKRD
jgi:hypothetical protein